MVALWLALGALFGGSTWKIGIWAERRPDADSATLRRFSDSLVEQFARRSGQPAKLDPFVLVPAGILPMAGGSPRHHPDLRDRSVDLAWGIPFRDTLSPALAGEALRAWIATRGCPDERQFSVGWDMFLLPQDPYNHPDSALWRMDATHWVRVPAWKALPDTGFDSYCLKLLSSRGPGRGPVFASTDTLRTRLEQALDVPLHARVADAEGRSASGAILELWRSVPQPKRSFAALLQGRPDSLRSDSAGVFPMARARDWFGRGKLVLGREGSNAVTYWRLSLGRRSIEGWFDAVDLARRSEAGGIHLEWTLSSGSSRSWKEASQHWPRGWLAAEADSAGTLTIGLSLPQETDLVFRVVDGRGKERIRTRPLHFPKGVHERLLTPGLEAGSWDLRADSPSDRFQVRFSQPPRRNAAPP